MTPSAPLAERLDPLFEPWARPGSPGCAVGVQRDGEWMLRAGYGLASLELEVPIAPDQVFRIASVSKQFTVAAALQLIGQGRLRLDEDVRVYVPELAPLPQVVRIEHLMRNTSGLPDFLELLRLGGVGLDLRVDRVAMLRVVAACRHLNFEPGSRFLYCNSNFLLLGLVVERLCGCTLGESLQRQIFGPLRMKDTALVVEADRPVPRLATPYLPDGQGGWRRAMHGFEHGGEGGLVSTVDDLLAWADELLRPRQLPPDLLRQLSAPTVLARGDASPYARGLEHGRWRGRRTVGHGGLWPGYRTEWLLLPDEALAVVVISNSGSCNPYQLARQVADAVLEGAGPRTVAAARPAPALDLMVGTWIDADAPALIDLAVVGGVPTVTQWGVPFALYPGDDGRWWPWRGAYEFTLDVPDLRTLRAEVGAGQALQLQRLPGRVNPPADLPGVYRCDDLDTSWTLSLEAADGDGAVRGQVRLHGPHAGGASWSLRGVSEDLVELIGASYWLSTSQLARVERDAAGRIVALRVFTSRVRDLRFVRQ